MPLKSLFADEMYRKSAAEMDGFYESDGRIYRGTNSATAGINDGLPERTWWCLICAKRWPVVLVSSLCSVLAIGAAGVFCALLYPILRELRAERVKAEDGTEVRILGFWSILVLSVSAGCICCVFSWTLTYLDSYQSGMAVLKPVAFLRLRDTPAESFHVGYGVAVLNGIMATITVIWSLS
ncbi:ADP-ribosylation factor-like protein 6-interacting protein 6 [Lampris incognitus]|uniref:ADP-ribosylation factor-like protein 6-interacting protein 6 n=1 Tax=Lampris incognitus TaxID=2546036 RepID=UPI0024B4DFC1|nr:ADP-ribosylation factor-like protein 6-interacting protein 6 [Lampris incognitus]